MPPRPHRAVAGAATAAAVLALTGCAGTNAVSQSVAGSNGYQSGDPTLNWVPVADRRPVSGVGGQLLDGRSFSLSAWKGKVVVVNFWTSNCGPCRAESDALNQEYRDARDRGVEFLGVDVRDSRASALAFARAHHTPYPSLYDPSNLLGLRFGRLEPNATPTTIVLDREGRVAARHSDEILFTQLRALVDRVLAEPA